jgi:MFS transporter, DHA1 family, tetracycline resistance protein
LRKNPALSLIFLVVFVDLLGFGILIPILPTFSTKELNINETAIGIAIAIYSFTQFLFNPFFGGLSDRYGRRRIILITLLINASGYIIFSFTESYLMLLISRVVAGIGGSSIAVAQAYIADITTRENRSKGMGLIGVAFGLGFVFGPLFGGILSKFSYMAAGFGAAGFSVIAFILSYFFLKESLPKISANNIIKRKFFSIRETIDIFRKPYIGLLILLFFVLTFSVANIYGTFALLGFKIYGFSDLENGYVYATIGIVSAIVQGGLIGKLTKRFTDNQLISAGAFLMMIGLAMLPYGINFAGIILISIILSFGTGTLQPILLSLVSKVTSESEQGRVLGVNQSLSALARVLGPLWGGFSFQYLGYQVPFFTGAIFTSLIFVFSIFYFARHIKVDEVV